MVCVRMSPSVLEADLREVSAQRGAGAAADERAELGAQLLRQRRGHRGRGRGRDGRERRRDASIP